MKRKKTVQLPANKKQTLATSIANVSDDLEDGRSFKPQYNRMNELDFSIGGNELLSELGDEFSSLLSNLSDCPKLGQLKGQLQHLQNETGLSEALPTFKQARLKRKLNYDLTVKKGAQWIPQVQRNAISEQLRFGDAASDYKQSTSSLSVQFKPSNNFEEELKEAIRESGVIEKNVKEAKALPMSEQVKEASTTQRLAQLRSLLFREHMKSKRMSKIKSKMWRKINRKTELADRERLLVHLERESPELAEKIRHEMEEKRAGMRMLKRQNARRKWAEVAIRFGGKDMQRVVSREAQNAHDEKTAINRIIRSAPGTALCSDDDNEDIDINFDTDEEDQSDSKTMTSTNRILSRAKSLVNKEINKESKSTTNKGLLGLKFMQTAMEKQRQKNQDDRDETLLKINSLEDSLMEGAHNGYEDTVTDSDGEYGTHTQKKNAKRIPDDKHLYKKKELPIITEALLNQAEKDLDKQLLLPNIQPNINSFTDKQTCSNLLAKPAGSISDTLKSVNRSLVALETPIPIHIKETPKPITRQTLSSTAEAVNSLLDSVQLQSGLEKALQQESLIREAFVGTTSNQNDFEKAVIEAQMEDEEETQSNTTKKFLPGWGSWIGEGIKTKRKKPNADKITTPKQPTIMPKIYINRRLDRKLAPYFVPTLPHPYNSKEQFELSRKHPLGPEWNTMQVHDRLIQPQVYVRPGTIIMPLEYAKHLPKDQADSLLDAWSHKTKKKPAQTKL